MIGVGKVNKEFLNEAIVESRVNEINNYQDGGPFGAVVVKKGKIIAKGHNTVVGTKDPTAHAEVNAIRNAAKILNTNDLSGCELYVNAQPCPMCLSAIIWANIKHVYYANTAKEAGEIGFRDDMIYEFIKNDNSNKEILDINHVPSIEAKKVFENFKNNDKKIMY